MVFTSVHRWHRRWFIPIEIALLVLIALVWWISSRSPMGKLRASGAPVTIDDLVPAPIADEENAAAVLTDAADALAAFRSDLTAFYESDIGRDYDRLDSQTPLPVAVTAAAEQLLHKHETLGDTLTELARREQYVPAINEARFDPQAALRDVQQWRSLSRYNTLRQRVFLARGDTWAAIEVAKQTLRLSNHLANEPLTTHRLVSAAIATVGIEQAERAWRLGDLDGEQIDRLDRALAGIEDRVAVRKTLESERVFALRALDQFPFYTGLLYREAVLNEFEEVIAICELPTDEAATAVGRLPPPAGLEPALAPLLTAEIRILAQSRCLRVAMALQANDGLIDAEALGLPKATLADPFTGRPLQIRTDESGGVASISSAGPDQLSGEGDDPTGAADNLSISP
ncbi:MAG: hypothetical protein AAF266_02035 [Planctomycetota bacterium]